MFNHLIPIRYRRKLLSICFLVVIGLLGSIYFPITNPLLLEEKFIYPNEEITFNNSLSYLITPPELFNNITTIQQENSTDSIINSIYKSLSNPKIVNSNSRFTNHFINSKIDFNKDIDYIKSYLEFRQSKHLYDPIITLSVYLNYLNTQYSENSATIPFSWEDWVDLSYLNEFLDDGKSLTCKQFVDKYKYEIDFEWNDSTPSSSLVDKTNCLDTMDYIITDEGKFRSKKLLPGFNFQKKLDKVSTFMGKAYNAKSYLLSYAPKPDFIYFLTDNGKYFRAETKQSSSMLRNGLLKNFLTSESYNGFNPIDQLSKLDKFYEIENENSFKLKLNTNNDYQIDIPEENFDVDFITKFKELLNKDDTLLKDNELNFKNSLKISLEINPDKISKYFDEVNIINQHEYKGHKVRENGHHYDARFFSGFISEMPTSEISIHNPISILNQSSSEIESTATPANIKNSILSHLSHLLFTVTFNDGLFLIPAHGTLLSWYFNSMSFPWDEDADVQMPIGDLAEFCLRYNNSMIVENPKYGTAKGFVDCATVITHREKGIGNNNIDARVIDIDSGMYIDITGLSVSEDTMDREDLKKLDNWISNELKIDYHNLEESRQREIELEKADREREEKAKAEKDRIQKEKEEKEKEEKEKQKAEQEKNNNDKDSNNNNDDNNEENKPQRRSLEKTALDLHKEHRIFNCRNRHFYSYDQLSPLRLTLYEGAPTFVAANDSALRSQLEIEYAPDALNNTEYESYHFSKALRAWLHAYDFLHAEISLGLNPKPNDKFEDVLQEKNIHASEIFPTYLKNHTEVFYELVKESLYDITSEDILYTHEYLSNEEDLFYNQSEVIDYLSESEINYKTQSKPFINLLEEVYHNRELTHAHEMEMMFYDDQWNLTDPNINDFVDLIDDDSKKTLGDWMLEDHAPPRIPLYDYIHFSEQEFKPVKNQESN